MIEFIVYIYFFNTYKLESFKQPRGNHHLSQTCSTIIHFSNICEILENSIVCYSNIRLCVVERKYDKKIFIVNYKTNLWMEFSVFNCIDNRKKNYDIRRKSISGYLNISLAQ